MERTPGFSRDEILEIAAVFDVNILRIHKKSAGVCNFIKKVWHRGQTRKLTHLITAQQR